MELKEGQVYKRIKGANVAFTVGKLYPVRIDENGVPFIVSDSGAPWYSGEIIDDRFELVQDNKGDKEMIKKGDIVEVIETDFSGGKVYEVGSRWEVVREDEKNGDYTDDIVYVKDDTRPSETASLYKRCVRKVEEAHTPVLELTWEEVQICMDTFNAYITNYGYKDTPIDKKALLTKMILFDDKYIKSLEEEK